MMNESRSRRAKLSWGEGRHSTRCIAGEAGRPEGGSVSPEKSERHWKDRSRREKSEIVSFGFGIVHHSLRSARALKIPGKFVQGVCCYLVSLAVQL